MTPAGPQQPGSRTARQTGTASAAPTVGPIRYTQSEPHVHETIGTNSRLDELHAAILRVKLPLLEAWNDKRRATASRYRAAIQEARPSSGLAAPVEIEGARHVYHHFTVRTPRRAEVQARLAAEGIGCAVYYPRALHEQRAYARWARGRLPEAERAATEVLSLPVHPWLTDDEIAKVAATLATLS